MKNHVKATCNPVVFPSPIPPLPCQPSEVLPLPFPTRVRSLSLKVFSARVDIVRILSLPGVMFAQTQSWGFSDFRNS